MLVALAVAGPTLLPIATGFLANTMEDIATASLPTPTPTPTPEGNLHRLP